MQRTIHHTAMTRYSRKPISRKISRPAMMQYRMPIQKTRICAS